MKKKKHISIFFLILVVFLIALISLLSLFLFSKEIFKHQRDLINDNAVYELLFFNETADGERIFFIDESGDFFFISTIKGEEGIELGGIEVNEIKRILSITTSSRFYGSPGVHFPHNNEVEKIDFKSLYVKDLYEIFNVSTTRSSENYGISEVEEILLQQIQKMNENGNNQVANCDLIIEKSKQWRLIQPKIDFTLEQCSAIGKEKESGK